MAEPIRIALIGAGLFAREAHVPAFNALRDRFEIAAIYSRSRDTAEKLLPHIHAGKPDIYTDLGALLKRDDIPAVDILLPIDVQPAVIDMAFAAGKHVVSEKPIAPDVAAGKRLIRIHSNHPQQVWMVAENFRFEPAFQRASEVIQSGEIGKVITAQWSLYLPTRHGNPYHGTAWRRSGNFPGGFLMDGGVHHAAALRQALGEITHVSAEYKQMLEDLKPADTMSAVMQFANGAIGSYTVTYAAGTPFPNYLTILGEIGALRVSNERLDIFVGGKERSEDYSSNQNVYEEMKVFAEMIRDGKAGNASALDGLRDVAVIEAMLKSSETGRRVDVDRLTDLESVR